MTPSYWLRLCSGFVLALVVAVASAANLPFNVAFPGTSTALDVSRTSPEHTTISLSGSDISIDDVTVDYQTYQDFRLPGEPVLFAEGKPSVPQVSHFYRIPNTGSVELQISDADYELLDSINSLPVQVEGKEFHGLVHDNLYSRDEWYPANVAEISEPMQMRDFRVVTVTLYPVQINPVTHQARVYHTLNVDIVANNTLGRNEIVAPRPPSRAWAETYRALIPNLEDDALLDMRRTPGSYLIVASTSNLMSQWVDSLKTWKTRQGFDVVVDTRPNWTVNTMRTAIQTAYSTWDPPLEYVCLMGDPSASFGVPTDGTGYDHVFALGNADDDLEDIGVGRLSGTSASEMATINAKIMAYERTPHMTDSEGNADTTWFHKSFLYADVAQNVASNWNLMQWADRQFRNFTGVDSNTVAWHSGQVNNALVISQLESGLAFFLWRGAWQFDMSFDLANQCHSATRLPIVWVIECNTGDFPGNFSLSESYLVAGTPSNLRGGICGIGQATAAGYAPYNVTITGGFVYAIANLGIENLSTCLSTAKLLLVQTYGTTDQWALNDLRWVNLMGEPSLSMWTDVPVVMSAEHPGSVPVGTQTVHVSVHSDSSDTPVEDALVVLWKGEETFARVLTDANGTADLPVTINTPGDLLLTINKRNHKPYLFTIPCVNSAQNVGVSSLMLDDDNAGGTQGNGNEQANPGEVIDLLLALRNYGTETIAQNVSAELTSENSHVAIVSGVSAAPDIAPGDSVILAVPLRIHVLPEMRNDEIATLVLNITTSQSTNECRFDLTCIAGVTEYVTHELNGEFGPGMTQEMFVTLRNGGMQPLENVSARLTSLSPLVTIGNEMADLGSVNPGEEVTNTDAPFLVSAASVAIRGYPVTMRLFTSTSAGPLDTMDFVLSIGTADSTDPAGPDAYGYFAYDNADTGYDNHPEFEFIYINNGLGTNLNLNDPGEKVTVTPVYSAVRALPFPFRFYGQQYDSITICTNGWVAFGNQSWNDCFRNYPIPGILAPDAMIAAYWDDLRTLGTGLGVWIYSDTTNHRFIIQWRTHGAFQPDLLEFEIVLYDEAFFPTEDHNGKVLVQYNEVTMNLAGDYGEPLGCSIGIQAPGAADGLEYARGSAYAPGAAEIHNGRAILFTTSYVHMVGGVAGVVRDAANDTPLSGVMISLNDQEYVAQTDSAGQFQLEDVLQGNYAFRAHLRRFNDFTIPDFAAWYDSTVIVNPALLHPELVVNADTISVSLPTDPPQASFTVSNPGNGPLECVLSGSMPDTASHELWDSLLSVPASQVAQDAEIYGCEFFHDAWWLCGGSGPHGGNNLYKLSADGELLESLPQPGRSENGWFDLATDGNYLYGSDSSAIVGVDTTGTVRATIHSLLNPATAIAYDPESDHFWIASYFADIYEINRSGQVQHQLDNQTSPLVITGLAWYAGDPQGYPLYVFSTDGDGPAARVTRVNPVSGERETVTDVPGLVEEHAGGCAITDVWNGVTVFGAIMQNNANDRFRVYLVNNVVSWMSISPEAFTVPGGEQQTVTLNFDVSGLLPATYHARLTLSNSVLDTVAAIPIVLVVESSPASDPHTALPTEFALYQNYPNPFNPSTEIAFDLPVTADVELAIFNTLGQRVATLLKEPRAAGRHSVIWHAANAASGVYLCRIQAGSFVETRKMIMLR